MSSWLMLICQFCYNFGSRSCTPVFKTINAPLRNISLDGKHHLLIIDKVADVKEKR